MNKIKLCNYLKEKKIILPLYFLKMYKDFDLNTEELVLLIYLYDKDGCIFDPMVIAKDLNIDFMKVMMDVSTLTDKNLVNVNTVKNDKGIMEEVFDLSGLFDKISMIIISDLNEKEENDINIHELIEKEFNRKLSPLEHDLIDEWENNNFDKNLIKEAVREASINGVSNLRYIDKILIDWNKKGYKVPSDIKKDEELIKDKVEVFNCDWLNDDEEI